MARAIMISEHVYKELTEMKEEGESYTKVIDKLIHKKREKKRIADFIGAWSFMSEKDLDEIEEEAKKANRIFKGTLTKLTGIDLNKIKDNKIKAQLEQYLRIMKK